MHMTWILSLLPMALTAIVLTAAEWRRNPAPADWKVNLQCWAVGLTVAITILPLLAHGGLPSVFDGKALPFWLALALFVLAMDLGEFLFHRAQHTVPFLWAMHALHHSDPDMSALTTQRHFWGDSILKSLTIWPAAAMLISPTPEIVAGYGVIGLWHFFAHARLDANFGRWSWLINSPAYHRRHHSTLPEHYNSNFAGLFPIYDVIFGTYHRPEGFPPTGLDSKPGSLREVLVWPLREVRRRAEPAAVQGR